MNEQRKKYQQDFVADKFEKRSIKMRPVSHTKASGRKRKFSAAGVVGDRAGNVGVAICSSKEASEAIKKCYTRAIKTLIKIPKDGTTIMHDVEAKFCAVKVLIRRAKKGTGIIAGNVMRDILEVAGIEDAVCKIIRGKNPLNVAQATIKALSELQSVSYFKEGL